MNSQRSHDPSAPRRRDGFRERGHQVTRVEAFIDAAFAFAVTLLVISIDAIPVDFQGLIDALWNVPAFAASFALVAMFWHAHHTWSRRTGLDDGVSVFLGLLLVFLVLVWVYPLRMMFGAAFSWLTMLTLPPEWQIEWSFSIESSDDIRRMFVIYGVAWSSLGFVIAALYERAWRRREDLGFDGEEQVRIRGEIVNWLCVPATGALSIIVAVLIPADAPYWALGMPGLVYSLMGFSALLATRAERRARRRLGVPASPRP